MSGGDDPNPSRSEGSPGGEELAARIVWRRWSQSGSRAAIYDLGFHFTSRPRFSASLNEQLVAADLLTLFFFFFFMRLCMIRDLTEGVGIDRRRWNPHVECRTIIRLKSEQKEGSCEGNVSPPGGGVKREGIGWCVRPSVHHIGESPAPNTLKRGMLKRLTQKAKRSWMTEKIFSHAHFHHSKNSCFSRSL